MRRVILGSIIALGLVTYSAPSAAEPEPITNADVVDVMAPSGRVEKVYGVTWCRGDVPELAQCDFRTDVIRGDIHHSALMPDKAPPPECPSPEIAWLAAMGKSPITMPPELLGSMSPIGKPESELLAGTVSCPRALPPTVIM